MVAGAPVVASAEVIIPTLPSQSSSAPETPTSAPDTSGRAGNPLGEVRRDSTWSDALSSAVAGEGSAAVVDLSDPSSTREASSGDAKTVLPALNGIVAAAGTVMAARPVEVDGSVLSPSRAAGKVASGKIGAGDVFSAGSWERATTALRDAGVDVSSGQVTAGDAARVMALLKRSDGSGGTFGRGVFAPHVARIVIGGMRQGDGGVLSRSVRGGKVAAVSQSRDGVRSEVGYVFDDARLLAYALEIPDRPRADIPGALGRVLSDMLADQVKESAPAADAGRGADAEDTRSDGGEVPGSDRGRDGVAPGQSAFD